VAIGIAGLYSSTNSGATWTQVFGFYLGGWMSVASSADGTRLVALARLENDGTMGSQPLGGVATSLNSGVTWTTALVPVLHGESIASSADGTKLVAAGSGIYTSSPSAVGSTTVGTAGSISGGRCDAVELQYIGNGTFTVLSHAGYLEVQ
jgi:hypothetical protein